MKVGLVHSWDGTRHFCYSFDPLDDRSLTVIELTEADVRKLSELPMEVQGEINISMGHAGMMATSPTWWDKKKAWLWRAGQRLRWRWIRLTRRST